ncbi:hypothetical protein PPACK8108_LOCUS14920 [Phakopsora pachyrhizi]|uniref:Uncharacterized protein n=1 Tax=Phakopsora pachyrhizi TaxID=170000 RepID=A0AAV0B8L1_PHAPC|nr:hypothetical protein PPACK8108_LOCUS14920 [Phakopsora pachyrhizi]
MRGKQTDYLLEVFQNQASAVIEDIHAGSWEAVKDIRGKVVEAIHSQVKMSRITKGFLSWKAIKLQGEARPEMVAASWVLGITGRGIVPSNGTGMSCAGEGASTTISTSMEDLVPKPPRSTQGKEDLNMAVGSTGGTVWPTVLNHTKRLRAKSKQLAGLQTSPRKQDQLRFETLAAHIVPSRIRGGAELREWVAWEDQQYTPSNKVKIDGHSTQLRRSAMERRVGGQSLTEGDRLNTVDKESARGNI